MDWIEEAKRLFTIERPDHFTNYSHCEECFEHDQTLLLHSLDTISLKELGSPGWDPICFSTVQGKMYYMPAFVRLSLVSMGAEFYFGQFLFHLEYEGQSNLLLQACSSEQKEFIVNFVEYVILNHPLELELNCYEDQALKVYELWSNALQAAVTKP